jgi:tetratricopeptide (TPR) repeat protein
MAEIIIGRAHLLMQQNRYEEAGKLLKDLLQQEPNNVQVLAMLSQVKLEQGEVKAAEELINSAISLSPDADYLYYVKARVCIQADRYDEAESLLGHAISLNPEDPDHFALWASIKLSRKKYEDALNLANEGLERDPENILALNIRSSALIKLDRKEDAFTTIEGALAHDPNNAYTHSNYGWGLLEKGNHKKALQHFREALKHDPTLVQAQAGMAEALKANYWFYRLFLRYAFFMSNLTAKYQWGVIIGLYLVTRVLKVVALNVPALAPFIGPLIMLLAIIAFSTWIIKPVSNVFLRLNPYGKYLLDREEKLASNFVAISILVCISGFVGYLLTGFSPWLAVAAFGFGMMVPLATMFDSERHKKKMMAYSGAMFFFGVAAIIEAFRTAEILNTYSIIFLIGFIAFQWIANYVNIRESNR